MSIITTPYFKDNPLTIFKLMPIIDLFGNFVAEQVDEF